MKGLENTTKASTIQNNEGSGQLLTEVIDELEKAGHKLARLPGIAANEAGHAIAEGVNGAARLAEKALQDVRSVGTIAGHYAGLLGHELYEENKKELKPITDAIESVPRGWHQFRKERPVTSAVLSAIVSPLTLFDGQKATPDQASVKPKASETPQSAQQGGGETAPQSQETRSLTVKAGDGYWNLAARALGLEEKHYNDAVNKKLLHLMHEMEDANGHRVLHPGQKIAIPNS